MQQVSSPKAAAYTMRGRTLPSHRTVTISGEFDFNFSSMTPGLSFRGHLGVLESVVTVECQSIDGQDLNFAEAWHKANDFARGVVQLLGFQEGIYLDVELDRLVVDGQEIPVHRDHPELHGLATAFTLDDSSFYPACQTLLSDPQVFLALSELHLALKDYHHAAISPYRAVERLRNALAGNLPERSDAWQNFRDKLNVDRSYLRPLVAAATPGRHGELLGLPAAQQNEILRRAWVLFDRFAALRLSGAPKLALTDYPILYDQSPDQP